MTITKTIIEHLCDNRGDENISKMTWVAIIFVVGAILLLLTTTAFKGPIQNWYKDTVAEWFSSENGQYSYDEWALYEKNENGTYKDVEYIGYHPDGSYWVLKTDVSKLVDGSTSEDCGYYEYNADGTSTGRMPIYFDADIEISPDGKTITVDGDIYHAQRP